MVNIWLQSRQDVWRDWSDLHFSLTATPLTGGHTVLWLTAVWNYLRHVDWRINEGRTPYEAYLRDRIFGCRCYAHIEKEHRKKFDSHTCSWDTTPRKACTQCLMRKSVLAALLEVSADQLNSNRTRCRHSQYKEAAAKPRMHSTGAWQDFSCRKKDPGCIPTDRNTINRPTA